jgi:hypothetical protein
VMNCEGCGGKRLWPTLRNCLIAFLEGITKTTKDLVVSIRDLALNSGPPEYEAAVLSNRQQCSMTCAQLLVICILNLH